MKTEKNITARINGKKIISDKMVLLFLSLFFSALIMFIFLVPQYEQMKIKEMEIELAKETLESKRDIVIKLASFNRTYKDINETEINKMYNLLPDNNNFEEHLASIDKIARINGILIKDISFSEHQKQKKQSANIDENSLKIANISLSVKSDFPNFISFLNSLEKSIPTVNIKDISIVKNKAENKDNNLENVKIDENIGAEIELSFYHL